MIYATDFPPGTEIWLSPHGPDATSFVAHDGSVLWALDAASKLVLQVDPKHPFLRVKRPTDKEPLAPWQYQSWSVLDLEATGLGPDDKIVEVAIVTMRFGQVVEVSSSLVNPGIQIPAEATAVHGITDAMVAGAPKIADLAGDILQLLDHSAVVVGYNIYGFDEGLLERELPGIWVGARPRIDPLPIVRSNAVGRWWKSEFVGCNGEPAKEGEPRRKKPGRHSLERASREVGRTTPEPGLESTLHRAAWDAILCGRVLWSLRGHCGHDAVVTEKRLRVEAARQSTELEHFKAKKRGEDQTRDAAKTSLEERVAELERKLAALDSQSATPASTSPKPLMPTTVDVEAIEWPVHSILELAEPDSDGELRSTADVAEVFDGGVWSGFLLGEQRLRSVRLKLDGRAVRVRLPDGDCREVAR